MSVSLFAGCTSTKNAGELPSTYKLYFGLNDTDAGKQIIPTEKAQEIARKIITDKGYGYTEYITYGACSEDNNSIENVTLVYEMLFLEYEEIEKIANETKEALNLPPVLIVEGGNNYKLK